jgi:hypothetical protein
VYNQGSDVWNPYAQNGVKTVSSANDHHHE